MATQRHEPPVGTGRGYTFEAMAHNEAKFNRLVALTSGKTRQTPKSWQTKDPDLVSVTFRPSDPTGRSIKWTVLWEEEATKGVKPVTSGDD